MATALIIGGAGFIGSHVARILLDQGHKVHVLDDYRCYTDADRATFADNMNYRHSKLLAGSSIHRGGVEDRQLLASLLQQACPDVVIHLANYPLAQYGTTAEKISGIVETTTGLCRSLAEWGQPHRLVYASSSMAYGDFICEPVPEDSRLLPTNFYGDMKVASEAIVRGFGHHGNGDCTIVRPCGVYGATDNNDRVVQTFIEKAIKGEPLKVVTSPRVFIDFTHVEDLADGIVRAALLPGAKNETFNLSRGEGRELIELAVLLQGTFPSLKIEHVEGPGKTMPRRGAMCIAKARDLLGYDPKRSLEVGFNLYFSYLMEQSSRLRSATGERSPEADARASILS